MPPQQVPELETGKWYALMRTGPDVPDLTQPFYVGKYEGIQTFAGSDNYIFGSMLYVYSDHTIGPPPGPFTHFRVQKPVEADKWILPIEVPAGENPETWQPTVWPLPMEGGLWSPSTQGGRRRRTRRRRRGSRKSKRGSRRH